MAKITITTAVVLIFFLLLELAGTYLASPLNCTDRKIYIRRLPIRYNKVLAVSCSRYSPLTINLCPYLHNSGLGPKVHDRFRSWHRTHHHLIEKFFHRRVQDYPCLIGDPKQANAIFLPYYIGLDSLRFLYGDGWNSSVQHGMDLFNYLLKNNAEIWRRNGGSDHFLISGRSSWDFSRPKMKLDWGTSFLELPEFFNVTVLTPESRRWSWQEQAIPYMTSFHPKNVAEFYKWVNMTEKMDRTSLMLFVKSSTDVDSSDEDVADILSQKILKECRTNSGLCTLVDCTGKKCEDEPKSYIHSLLHSKFCLHPPGISPTTRQIFDGIIAGCIPVFFDEMTSSFQYKWHLKFPEKNVDQQLLSTFSVFISEKDVVEETVTVLDVLTKIGEKEVNLMRKELKKRVFGVMYRSHKASPELKEMKDAFDLAIDGVFQRIKTRQNH